jgi:tetraacyldisaccharide 4'-kinase
MGNRKYLLLYPFSIIYRLVTDIRNILFDNGILTSEEFNIPVICVGNITVGGTGKTPLTEYLVDLLSKEFNVAVLSRGYKRKSSGFRIADLSSTVREVGDEPLQIFRKYPEIIVAVDKNRRNGIRTILKKYPDTDVIIMDDGFQHRWVKPGFSILITDYSRLITRDYLMPYGKLRENRNNRKRAGLIIVSKMPGETGEQEMTSIAGEVKYNSRQKIFFTSFSYNNLIPLFENKNSREFHFPEAGSLNNNGAVLITGIAVPGSLKQFLEQHFRKIIHLNFPDHYYFRERDIEKIREAWKNLESDEKILITTEKDAVRLREFTNIEDQLKRALHLIPVKVSFLKNDKKEFDNLIIEYVRENKRDNRIP